MPCLCENTPGIRSEWFVCELRGLPWARENESASRLWPKVGDSRAAPAVAGDTFVLLRLSKHLYSQHVFTKRGLSGEDQSRGGCWAVQMLSFNNPSKLSSLSPFTRVRNRLSDVSELAQDYEMAELDSGSALLCLEPALSTPHSLPPTPQMTPCDSCVSVLVESTHLWVPCAFGRRRSPWPAGQASSLGFVPLIGGQPHPHSPDCVAFPTTWVG